MNAADKATRDLKPRRIALAVGMEGMGSLLPLVLKALAAEEPAEIAGTFVEDQNLLNLAELPVFKEVCRVTRVTSQQEPQDLKRQLRLRAAATRAALLNAAEGAGARWSFHIAQGSICAEARKSADQADIVVIAAARRTVATSADIRLYAEEWVSVPMQTRRKEAKDANRPIAIYVDSTSINRRALTTAVSIAKRFHRPLIVFTEQPTIDLKAAIVNIAQMADQPRLIGISDSSPKTLADAARTAQTALLVIPVVERFLDAEAIRHFHEESNAPTLIVQDQAPELDR